MASANELLHFIRSSSMKGYQSFGPLKRWVSTTAFVSGFFLLLFSANSFTNWSDLVSQSLSFSLSLSLSLSLCTVFLPNIYGLFHICYLFCSCFLKIWCVLSIISLPYKLFSCFFFPLFPLWHSLFESKEN